MRFVIAAVKTTSPNANYDEFNELCETARHILERSELLTAGTPSRGATVKVRVPVTAARPQDRKQTQLIQLLSAVCVT